MIPLFLSLFFGSVMVSTGSPAEASAADAPAAESQTEAQAAEAIGTVAEVQGDVMAIPSEGNVRQLAEGDPVYLNETITTASGASVQIELADESLFTISQKTTISVNEFDYDENAADGNLGASVTKGIFRFISGKIAKAKPEKVNIEIPSGVIGIRGTIVVGEIEGERCLVSLEAEKGDKAKHRIIVTNKTGDKIQEVEITKPGFATVIEKKGQAPKPIFQLPPAQVNRFQQNLARSRYLPRGKDGRPKQNPNVMNPREHGARNELKRRDEKNKKGDGPNPPGGGQGPQKNGNSETSSGRDGLKREKQPFSRTGGEKGDDSNRPQLPIRNQNNLGQSPKQGGNSPGSYQPKLQGQQGGFGRLGNQPQGQTGFGRPRQTQQGEQNSRPMGNFQPRQQFRKPFGQQRGGQQPQGNKPGGRSSGRRGGGNRPGPKR